MLQIWKLSVTNRKTGAETFHLPISVIRGCKSQYLVTLNFCFTWTKCLISLPELSPVNIVPSSRLSNPQIIYISLTNNKKKKNRNDLYKLVFKTNLHTRPFSVELWKVVKMVSKQKQKTNKNKTKTITSNEAIFLAGGS